jgi:hypothetical protein
VDDSYFFLENVFLLQDIEVMNFKSTKDSRGGFFNQMVICVKTLLERDDIVGTLTVNGWSAEEKDAREERKGAGM